MVLCVFFLFFVQQFCHMLPICTSHKHTWPRFSSIFTSHSYILVFIIHQKTIIFICQADLFFGRREGRKVHFYHRAAYHKQKPAMLTESRLKSKFCSIHLDSNTYCRKNFRSKEKKHDEKLNYWLVFLSVTALVTARKMHQFSVFNFQLTTGSFSGFIHWCFSYCFFSPTLPDFPLNLSLLCARMPQLLQINRKTFFFLLKLWKFLEGVGRNWKNGQCYLIFSSFSFSRLLADAYMCVEKQTSHIANKDFKKKTKQFFVAFFLTFFKLEASRNLFGNNLQSSAKMMDHDYMSILFYSVTLFFSWQLLCLLEGDKSVSQGLKEQLHFKNSLVLLQFFVFLGKKCFDFHVSNVKRSS